MKISRSSPFRPSGTALVIVLASLIFLSALALAFLAGVGTELKSSKAYADGTTARILADNAANLVMAQIKTATSGTSASGDLAWASQPGMIRTYDDQGTFHRAYKLYSSRNWVMTNAVDAAAEAAVLANWRQKPAHFTDLNAPASGQYPILDPGAEGVVEGFSFSNLPEGMAKGEMPVEWLYVLKNGDIVPPDAAASATQTATIPGASKDNPIVGRIAFWADDETAKVNINTASEGTFWDTPRVITAAERNLGKFQPVKNEFQRYPGHPAMTSLRTALPGISSASLAYAVAPQYEEGGSLGGTVGNVTAPMTPKKDRLYASIDELAFDPDRNPQGVGKSNLNLSRFFLTASSRAPEVNVFNEPRVAIWPVHQNSVSGYRTPEDEVIAFCSTINGLPYYFQRANASSPTSDYANIGRNQELFGYLQNLTEKDTPGFGGDFLGKYGTDRDQILTEVFDYVRAVNINDQRVANPFASTGQVSPIFLETTDTMGFGRFPTLAEVGIAFAHVGNGPLTSGAGNTAASPVSPAQHPPYPGTDGNGTPPANAEVMLAYLVMSFMNPSMGYPTYVPSFTVEVEGLDRFKVNNVGMGFPNSASTYIHWAKYPASFFGHISPGGGLDPRWAVIEKRLNTTSSDPLRFPFFSQPIVIPTQRLGYNGTYFGFQGGEITVRIYAGDSTAPENLVQTIRTTIQPNVASLPPPWKAEDSYRLIGTGTSHGGYGDRFANCHSGDVGGTWRLFGGDSARDTVRTVALTSGDARAAFKRNVGISDALYSATPVNAGTPNVRSSFCANSGYSFFYGSRQGKLVDNVGSTLFANLLSGSVNGVRVNGESGMPVGDFDNGIASMPDGPYINKSDEGDMSGMAAGRTPYFDGWGKYSPVTLTYSSPNRQVPSSGMLGSLPTGVKEGKPWRTLLFRPDPSGLHPGGLGVPDHIIMDLFWMPVVEPYPISEPFSTAGKINMNTQIMPFSFIVRETGVRAALKAERILAVPQSKVQNYKNLNNIDVAIPPDADFRFDINLDETLVGLRQRFVANDLYRSASEICEIALVPKDSAGTTYAGMSTFWNDYLLTGDNSKERPYANIYPRLTTKSNTFTVHSRVQTLQNRQGDPADQWTEGRGRITGEYRGSTFIERYIDPNDTRIPDYATASNPEPLDRFYKFRVPATKQFNP